MRTGWQDIFPFKCIFGFTGDINGNWEEELNELVKIDPNSKVLLPDVIIVNKKGMIKKLKGPTKGKKAESPDLRTITKDFHYTDFSQYAYYGSAITMFASALYSLSQWQNDITPNYASYFNKDL